MVWRTLHLQSRSRRSARHPARAPGAGNRAGDQLAQRRLERPMSRIAVVLFNLGGPDGPKAVRPFLKNLFSDPAIIGAPAPLRWGLAELISRVRAKSAIANYAVMGGGSPLAAETQAQAAALQAKLAELRPSDETRVF